MLSQIIRQLLNKFIALERQTWTRWAIQAPGSLYFLCMCSFCFSVFDYLIVIINHYDVNLEFQSSCVLLKLYFGLSYFELNRTVVCFLYVLCLTLCIKCFIFYCYTLVKDLFIGDLLMYILLVQIWCYWLENFCWKLYPLWFLFSSLYSYLYIQMNAI